MALTMMALAWLIPVVFMLQPDGPDINLPIMMVCI